MSTFQNFLFELHSGVRWLVVLATVIAFFWMLVGMIRSGPYDERTHRVMVIWSSLVGLQWLLGIILFLALGSFGVGYRWEHAVTMTAAVIVAHLYNRFKNRAPIARYRVALIVIIGVAVLVYIGVARLPQGWQM